MNRNLRAAFALILFTIPGIARGELIDPPQVEITPFYGWQFGGGVTFQSGDMTVADAANYGGYLSYRVHSQGTVEFLYNRQDTELRFRGGPLGAGTQTTGATLNYWQIGGLYEALPGNARPFVNMTLGLTHMNPDDANFASTTRFSFTLGGGVKAFLNRHLGVRLQANTLGTFLSGDGGIFCGPLGGCYVLVGGEVVFQANVLAGVIIGF